MNLERLKSLSRRPLVPSKWVTACVLGGAGLAGLVAVSGFPARVGLTRSEAALSLPGDLLFPQAPLCADRSGSLPATRADLWPDVLSLAELYSDIWSRELVLECEEDGYAAIWRTTEENAAEWEASLSAVLLPGVDGQVTLRLRERYTASNAHCRHLRRGTALAAPLIFRRLRHGQGAPTIDDEDE